MIDIFPYLKTGLAHGKRALAYFTGPYEGVRRTASRGTVGSGPPTDFRNELDEYTRTELMRHTRHFQKNSGLHRGIVKDTALYTVGDGIKPLSLAVHEPLRERYEKHFRQWAKSADITGRFSFGVLQHLACKAMDVDGEIFVLKVRNEWGAPRIQLVPAHRVGSFGDKRFTDGIRFNGYGAPVEYRIMQDNGKAENYPAGDVLHLFDPECVTAARNAPTLSHAVPHLQDEDELLKLEKHAVKDNADKSLVIYTEDGAFGESEDFAPEAGSETEPEASDVTKLQKIIGGKLVALKPGERMEAHEFNRPSPTFTGFLEHMRRDSVLGTLPYEFVADPSDVGGAGVRLVVAKADRVFNWRQTLIIEQLIGAVWFFVIGDAIHTKALPASLDWWEISCVTPRRVSVDAGRDSNANREDVEMGLKTLSDHFAEGGADFRDEARKRAEDAKFLMKLAKDKGVPLAMIYSPKRPVNTDINYTLDK